MKPAAPNKLAIRICPTQAYRQFEARVSGANANTNHSLIIHDAANSGNPHSAIEGLLAASKFSAAQIRDLSRRKDFEPFVIAQNGSLQLVLIGRQMQFNNIKLPYLQIRRANAPK